VRAFGFKEKQRADKAEKERDAALAALNQNTEAIKALTGLLSPKAQPQAQPGAAAKNDDDWIKEVLGIEKTEPVTQPPPAQPEKHYLTAEDMEKLLEERDKKVREDIRKEAAVEQQMGTTVSLLKQLFTDKDGKQDDAKIAEAIEVVRNEAIRIGYPPMAVATLLFGDKIHERQAIADRAQAKQELDLEYKKNLAERGISLVAAGLEPPPPPSEQELAQADELKYMQEHEDELRKGNFDMPLRGPTGPQPAPRR